MLSLSLKIFRVLSENKDKILVPPAVKDRFETIVFFCMPTEIRQHACYVAIFCYANCSYIAYRVYVLSSFFVADNSRKKRYEIIDIPCDLCTY